MRRFVQAFLAIFAPVLLFGQASAGWGYRPANSQDARPAPAWLKTASIYQVWVRSFTPEGTLKGVTRQLPHIKELGASVVYLCPIYAGDGEFNISDYFAINPRFGTEADLKELVQSAHKMELRVMLDVVYYHTSPNNELLKQPGFYKRNPDGQIALGLWKLPLPDFANPAVRRYFIGNMVHWVKDFGVDAFRCDVSGGSPLTFWEEARDALDQVRRDVVMLAECDMPEDQLKAFDISYNYPYYWYVLRDVMTLGDSATRIRAGWQKAHSAFPRGARFLHFNDNHDQQRATLVFGTKGALATSVLNFTLDGIPFLFMGQEYADAGDLATGPHFPNKPAPGAKVSNRTAEALATYDIYQRLFQLRKEEPAIYSGDLVWIDNADPDSVVSFLRKSGDDEILVAINLSNRKVQGCVDLPWANYSNLHDLVKNNRVPVPIQQGKVCYTLNAFGYIVGKKMPLPGLGDAK